MTRRTIVLDTSVLLSDPGALLRFGRLGPGLLRTPGFAPGRRTLLLRSLLLRSLLLRSLLLGTLLLRSLRLRFLRLRFLRPGACCCFGARALLRSAAGVGCGAGGLGRGGR